MPPSDSRPAAATLTEAQRAQAMVRFAVLQPHLEREVPLARAAREAGVALRTARRWLRRYRRSGLAGLVRGARNDRGRRKTTPELVWFVEGLVLRKPRPSVATIHRRVCMIAAEHGWRLPSYGSLYSIIGRLDPALLTLAHEGAAAFRDRYELLHRHRAARPNALWQADHTQLDVLILDASGKTVRPWLTLIMDDHSRAVVGYLPFIGAPSALQTSLALRQAIWRKADPHWAMCGIPDVLYVDHGSDFTSRHLEQVAADLHFELVYSTIARPQGRGKVERLFGTVNTELLPELPGHLVRGKPVTAPRLTLSELDRALGAYLVGTYNCRTHSEIGAAPLTVWRGQGWLPRMPQSLEELDLLLITVARERCVHRDGIHFQGLRYLDPTLAAYVGEAVTIRFDPRDLGEVRVFHRNRFLCRAVSPEHAGQEITLKDIQAARTERRRRLHGQLRERIGPLVDRPADSHAEPMAAPAAPAPRRGPTLRTYREDRRS